MKKKALFVMVGACFFVLLGCSTKKSESSQSSTKPTTTETKKSSTTKETSHSSSKKEETPKTSSSEAPKETSPLEEGRKLLLGKWKTKDPNAHVIVENTYLEDGTYINFSDARGDTSTGNYEVLAFDGQKITFKTFLNGLEHTSTLTFVNNNTELTATDEASGIVESYVKE